MDERTLKAKMTERGLSVKEGTNAQRIMHLGETLKIIFGKGTPADKITFRRLCGWLLEQCDSGQFEPNEILPRVIDFALESANPQSRNPKAVFISICKKELRWKP